MHKHAHTLAWYRLIGVKDSTVSKFYPPPPSLPYAGFCYDIASVFQMTECRWIMTWSLFVRVSSGLTCPSTKKNMRWVFTVTDTCIAESRTSGTNGSCSFSLVEASSWSHHEVRLLVWKSRRSQCLKWFEGGNVEMASLILKALFTAVNCWNTECAPLLCCSVQVSRTSVMGSLWHFGACVMCEGEGNRMFGSTDLVVVQTAVYLIGYSDCLTGLFGHTDLVVV